MTEIVEKEGWDKMRSSLPFPPSTPTHIVVPKYRHYTPTPT
jgi:hypothetical protein